LGLVIFKKKKPRLSLHLRGGAARKEGDPKSLDVATNKQHRLCLELILENPKLLAPPSSWVSTFLKVLKWGSDVISWALSHTKRHPRSGYQYIWCPQVLNV
jgi:hypothetical protein